MGAIYNQIPRGNMIDRRIRWDPEILFKITKKETDLVIKMPRYLQDEYEDYKKLKYKFDSVKNEFLDYLNYYTIDT